VNRFLPERLIEEMRVRQIAEARQRMNARAMSIREDAALQAEGEVETTLGQLDTTVEEYAATVDELWRRPRLAPAPDFRA
jgi:hypothetical protein